MDGMLEQLLNQIRSQEETPVILQSLLRSGVARSPSPMFGYETPLHPLEEMAFRQWLHSNKVPYDLGSRNDYDMRGFFKGLMGGDPKATSAIDQHDKQMHYPDYWKIPGHESFSNESKWAGPNAPSWNSQDQLQDKTGRVLYDAAEEARMRSLANFLWGGGR